MFTLEGEQFVVKDIDSWLHTRVEKTQKKSRTEADTIGELTISTSTKGWRKAALKNEKLIQCSKNRRSRMATQNQGGKVLDTLKKT